MPTNGRFPGRLRRDKSPDARLLNLRARPCGLHRRRLATGGAAPGLIPEVPFFTLQVNRRFPVTDWIRSAAERDDIVDPDTFHDLFGHVPLLFDPRFANLIQAYGQGALKAHTLEHGPGTILAAVEIISRLCWYTFEIGLVLKDGQLRAYGVGILSSPGELVYSVSPVCRSEHRGWARPTCGAAWRRPTRLKATSSSFLIAPLDMLQGLTTSDFTPQDQTLARQAS